MGDIKREATRVNRNFISPPIWLPINSPCSDNNGSENMPGIYPQLIILLDCLHLIAWTRTVLFIYSPE